MDALGAGTSGSRGPLAKPSELLGVSYGGRLLNGAAGQAADTQEDKPSVALLRCTLLQLQRALTQNGSLSDALKEALASEERISVMLRKHKIQLEEAAAEDAAAAEKNREIMNAELEGAKRQEEENRSLILAEMEQMRKAALEAKDAAKAEASVC